MRRITRYPVDGKNSMQHWTEIVSPMKVVKNFAIIQVGRYCPSLRLKAWLYSKGLGIKLEKDVSLGLMAMVDIFFPENISIGENTIIGYNCTLLTHEYLTKEYRIGSIRIGKGVMIGANTTVLPGVEIGDNAVIGAGSLVNCDVPPGALAVGVPIVIKQKDN